MTKLSSAQCKTIEEFWINIKDYEKQLKFREWELLHPYQETESSKVQNGQVTKPTENKAMILMQDERYQFLKKVVDTIEQLYTELDSDLKTIVDLRYWSDDFYEWEEIADQLYMSRHKVLRKRNRLIQETAKRIGWV